MVVQYAAASEGSWLSFFVITPKILFCHPKGSIIPKVLPQVVFAVALTFTARFWNPLEDAADEILSGISTISILMSFLIVFKTQSAYAQFWEACGEVNKMLQVSRQIAMTACTYFPFDCERMDGSEEGWTGGILRMRVLAAYQLRDEGHDDRQGPYAIVQAGGQSFKTKTASSRLKPVWNSEVFEFVLNEVDTLVTLVLQDAGPAELGEGRRWLLHLRSEDLLKARGNWQRARHQLMGKDSAEVELEMHFAPRRRGGPVSGGCPTLVGAKLEASPQHHRKWMLAHTQDGDLSVEAFLRRIIRLLALHFFVVVEFFRRTGTNAVVDRKLQDDMRDTIKMLTGEREYAMLYPGDDRMTPGSEAKNVHAKPTVVLYWLQLTIGRCATVHELPSPILSSFVPLVSGLAETVFDMDKIDKLQFPLPYAQVVKILCIVLLFVLLPWVLQPKCKILAELVVGIIALGFFGLDEVAEILESPFGNDPNHIDLQIYGQDLLDDLELMYYSREKELDIVFTEKRSPHGLFHGVLKRSVASRAAMKAIDEKRAEMEALDQKMAEL
mmetsp:Transcript_74935/g.236858  ORF Transcript_74935/g.236858 Transcript_74935/m.236858 type:complete len:554 (-) Transcript_74935:98-1759(-)